MTRIVYISIVLVILAIGFSSSYWIDKPVQANPSHTKGIKNCNSCHENSIDQNAWEGFPEWHDIKFRNPELNAENREKHRSEAHKYRNTCKTCHASNFQVKCADCHTPNELKQ